MAQIKRSNRRRDLSPVHPDAAAIDIGATMHVAAVSPDRDPEPVRTFGTVTDELHRLADWFGKGGIKNIALGATGGYWIPAYEILEETGVEGVLGNGPGPQALPGRQGGGSDPQ